MKRTHLATEATVGALLERFERFRAIPKTGERKTAMQPAGCAAVLLASD
jgi:hypothetical protein